MHHHRLSKRHRDTQLVTLSSPQQVQSISQTMKKGSLKLSLHRQLNALYGKLLVPVLWKDLTTRINVLEFCDNVVEHLLKFKPPQQYTASPTLPSRTPFPKTSISKSLSGPYSNRLSSTTLARRYVPVYSRSPSAVLLTQVQDTNCEANMGTTQNKVL